MPENKLNSCTDYFLYAHDAGCAVPVANVCCVVGECLLFRHVECGLWLNWKVWPSVCHGTSLPRLWQYYLYTKMITRNFRPGTTITTISLSNAELDWITYYIVYVNLGCTSWIVSCCLKCSSFLSNSWSSRFHWLMLLSIQLQSKLLVASILAVQCLSSSVNAIGDCWMQHFCAAGCWVVILRVLCYVVLEGYQNFAFIAAVRMTSSLTHEA
jgi:hypothetical protein